MNIVFHYLKQKVHFKHKIVRALTENLIYVLQSKHIAKPIRKWTMSENEKQSIYLLFYFAMTEKALTRAFREYLSIHK